MKILFHANAPWCATGYGIQGKHLTRGWHRLGHEVFYSAYYGMHGGSLNLGGVTILSKGLDAWGNDIIEGHCRRTKADLVVSLVDIWVLDPTIWGNLPALWAPWFPVDQLPVPPQVVAGARQSHYPLVYSRFAQRAMEDLGLETRYVPHGVDIKVFHPMDRCETRERCQVEPDTFLVGMVAANRGNPSRKNFWQQMRAFSVLHDHHPEARLYIHTLPLAIGDACPLDRWAEELGIEDVVEFPAEYNYTQGFPDDHMASMYNCFDVLLNASHGEGFGIPILEAQATGTPVITTNWTAMTELTWSGHSVPIVAEFKNTLGGCWGIPSLDGIIDALEDIYSWPDEHREAQRQVAVARAEEFDWDLLIDTAWKSLLDELESDMASNHATRCIHDWAPTGISDDGAWYFPCRRDGCRAALRTVLGPSGCSEIRPDVFGMNPRGVELDIEDGPDGGVCKIVAFELDRDDYGLADIPFEKGDVVIDIGAHVGMVSIFLAKQYPDLRIVAFEPVPENYARLLRNLEANGVENVTPVDAAVTCDGRDISMVTRSDQNTGAASEFVTAESADSPVEARSVTPSQIFAHFAIDRCQLLKIDAEGAEYEILAQAALEGLLEKVDYLSAEVHASPTLRRMGYSPGGLEELCERYIEPGHLHLNPGQMET